MATLLLLRIAPLPGVDQARLGRHLASLPPFTEVAGRTLPASSVKARALAQAGETGRLDRALWHIEADASALTTLTVSQLAEGLAAEARRRVEGVGLVVAAETFTEEAAADQGQTGQGQAGQGEAGQGETGTPPVESGASWEDYAPSRGGPNAGKPLPDTIVQSLLAARAAVPREPGLRRIDKTLPDGRRWEGHMYTGGADAGHVAYVKAYLESRARGATPEQKRAYLAFAALQAREGSTTAINSYDTQIVTWGTGWAGVGTLGRVMEKAAASQAVRDAFSRCGLRYAGKVFGGRRGYDVADLEARQVVSGVAEALQAVRASVDLLHLLIHVARAPETRDAVTEAQLDTFLATSADVERADIVETQALFNFVVHLKHWLSGYADGALVWAEPQVAALPKSADRDRKIATLVGRYFYGKAARADRTPDWVQFKRFWHDMATDGLDCDTDPFYLAAAPPKDVPEGV